MPHKTGIEDYAIIKNSRKLRYGYTTGTCAAAAAKGAARMLLSGRPVSHVRIMTPKGIGLDLPLSNLRFDLTEEQLGSLPKEILTETEMDPDASGQIAICETLSANPGSLRSVTCAVRKDAGDDPDVTDGILVYATAFCIPEKKEPRVTIEGGTGVGRVTRPGMARPVGEAAINPGPLQMIRSEVEQVCSDFGYNGSIRVVISIPEGEAIANKTFNPRLGIEGGLSILGTSGIVVPMSEKALLASIELEMKMLLEKGQTYLLITPGNYGEAFAKAHLPAAPDAPLQCSNYVGETLDLAVNLGVKGVLFVAHIGKFIKVAGGIMNTHSREADCRAELMAAFALRAGAGRETAMQILESVTTDEALQIMDKADIRQQAMALVIKKIHEHLQRRVGKALPTEVILFSGTFGLLAQTDGAAGMLRLIAGVTVGDD